MSWTYDSSMPTNKDKVRFLIQDTDTNKQLLTNEEIEFTLTEYPGYKMAAATCADVLSSHFASMSENRTIGNLSLQHADRSKKYAALANRLRSQASKTILPYAGGVSVKDKNSVIDDPDRVKPLFARNMLEQQLPEVNDPDAV